MIRLGPFYVTCCSDYGIVGTRINLCIWFAR